MDNTEGKPLIYPHAVNVKDVLNSLTDEDYLVINRNISSIPVLPSSKKDWWVPYVSIGSGLSSIVHGVLIILHGPHYITGALLSLLLSFVVSQYSTTLSASKCTYMYALTLYTALRDNIAAVLEKNLKSVLNEEKENVPNTPD